MKQEALELLPGVRDELEAAVESALYGEPDGLHIVTLRERICKHPEYDVYPNVKYLPTWLSELAKDDMVMHDYETKRYLLPRYADKDREAYRPNSQRLE